MKNLTMFFSLALAPLLIAGHAQQLSSSSRVPDGLAKSDWQSIRAAYEAGRHGFQPNATGWQAHNPGQQWMTTFDGRGFLAQPLGAEWTWGLELRSYGFDNDQHAISDPPVVKAEGQRLSYDWTPAVQEWFVNDTRGLEHGFIIKQRLASAAERPGPLGFNLAVRGSLIANVTTEGQAIEFRDQNGVTVLNYAGLKVWDATGRVLPSYFEMAGSSLKLWVQEQGAQYPLTIDPIAQQALLQSPQAQDADGFGECVAVSGDTVVVGAPFEDSAATGVNGDQTDNNSTDSGAAYVFVRVAGAWALQAYLKASNTDVGEYFDYFGTSVAISGNTIVVGAYQEDSAATGVNGNQSDNTATSSGAAYVFVRSGTNWSQQAYLKSSNSETSDLFGFSVGVSGDTVVVGAWAEDSNATGVNGNQLNNSLGNSGAAYVFVRNGTSWTQQAYLKSSNPGFGGGCFGRSVAIFSDSIIVGAYSEVSSNAYSGAAYIFNRVGSTWSEQAYLTTSITDHWDYFGESVAIWGDTVVVGAPQEDSIATGINGNQTDNNGTNSGAAYVFKRSGSVWSQQAYLKASNTGVNDQFGLAVAISGDTIIVGAPYEDSNATGVNGNQTNNLAQGCGACYLFTRSGTTWTQQSYIKAGTITNGFGGRLAAADGLVIVEGGQGAYIFADVGPTEIVVEQPVGVVIFDGGSKSFGAVITGGNTSLTFTLKNLGSGNLTLTGTPKVAVSGADASFFTVTAQPASPVSGPFGISDFTLRFAPSTAGVKTAALSIANDDPDEDPFDILIMGTSLSSSNDTDGDGMDDAMEFRHSAEGFDWQVNQMAKVNAFKSNLTLSGYLTTAQVQALNIGTPLIQKNPVTGLFKLTIGLQKSTNLKDFTPFPMMAPQTLINGEGKLEFNFSSPNQAEFYLFKGQ